MSDTINTNLVRHGCNVCPGGGHGWALQIISAYYVYQMSAAQKHQCWILAGRFMCAATQHLQNTSLSPILTHCNNNKWMHIYFRMSFTHFSPTHKHKKNYVQRNRISAHICPPLSASLTGSHRCGQMLVLACVCVCVYVQKFLWSHLGTDYPDSHLPQGRGIGSWLHLKQQVLLLSSS